MRGNAPRLRARAGRRGRSRLRSPPALPSG